MFVKCYKFSLSEAHTCVLKLKVHKQKLNELNMLIDILEYLYLG